MKLDDTVKASRYKKTVAIDPGEIHPITFSDGNKTLIYNGRLVRSIKQYREKLKATFQSMMDKCKKYSRRWWKLNRSKQKQLGKINNQIKDARHKITRHFANSCKSNRVHFVHRRLRLTVRFAHRRLRLTVGVVVIGDLTGIRKNIDYGHKANQKLHQWAFAEITRQLKYKLEEFGIKVVDDGDERDTTKTCPDCARTNRRPRGLTGHKNKPNNRNYHCQNCGFKYHRDGVGALNILNKYRGDFPFNNQKRLFPRSRGGWLPPQVEGVRFP